MSQLRGQVVLIVNVASQCGFTYQYKDLQDLYDAYKDRGFQILAFPSNQFGQQEPGEASEISSFCEINYGVTFQMMEKVEVNGPAAHPIYSFLTSKARLLGLRRVLWNFEKFLVDREGVVVGRWSSVTNPQSLRSEIEKIL
eukprot:TRINITY_DN10543_c0_g1_i19.p1 TRINITY_DN10543_c0_g1~~TRINITY_DN10543_c0_g1_i19.p1  ORF type:complete len:141 (+),score=16.46 TRINITY_DN10543_c0_g1_i19:195-617(+)